MMIVLAVMAGSSVQIHAQDFFGPSKASASQERSATAIEEETAFSFEQLLDGHFAGVQVITNDGAPGSAFTVRIRGVKSFRGDSQPLYILDGVVLNSPLTDADRTFWRDEQDYQSLQNTLDNINPRDIEKIEVLKDAAATAIYGSMGGNGVVIITTKKGSSGKPKTTWNSTVAFSTIQKSQSLLGLKDYIAATGLSPAGEDADWQSESFGLGVSHKHHVGVAGGTDRNAYRLAVGYNDIRGIMQASRVQNATVNASFSQKWGQLSDFGVSLNLGFRKNDMVMASSPLGSSSATKSIWMSAPSSDVQDSPSAWIAANDDYSTQYSMAPSMYVNAHLGYGIWFKVNAGFDFRNKARLRWIGDDVTRGKETSGMAGQSGANSMRYNADAAVAYEWGSNPDHSLKAMVGAGILGNTFAENIYEGTTFFSQELRAPGISLSENVAPYRHLENNTLSVATYVSLSYNYKERYFVGASARAEMLDRYDRTLDFKDLYPSAYAAWDIAREGFMAGQNAVNRLKLRFSWGKSGSQQVLPYGYDSYYVTGVAPDFTMDGLTNYYTLRWKNITEQYNVGLDMGFIEDRLQLEANLYRAVSSDAMSYYYHTPGNGYDNVYTNRADILNRGVEVSLKAVLVRKGDFSWDASALFAANRNEILDNGAEGDVMGGTIGKWNGSDVALNVNRVGESVSSFYGYKTQGIVKPEHTLLAPAFNGTRLQEGDLKFIDVTGDGTVDENDMTIIGNPIPEFTASLSTTFRWKDLSIYAALDGAFGFDVANIQRLYDVWNDSNTCNLSTSAYVNAYPDGERARKNAVGTDVISSNIIEDGSYVRLRDLAVSYDIPMGKVRFIDGVSIIASAHNLATFSRYSGWSPMANSYGHDLTRQGIDNGAYPAARTFMLGLTVKF